jgi:hypothetical protein
LVDALKALGLPTTRVHAIAARKNFNAVHILFGEMWPTAT